jgi:DNA uptake protein ComE-like DNA-binding protein
MTELDSEKKLEQYSDSSEISKKEIDFYSNNKYNSSFKQLNSETVFGAMNTLNVLESMLDYKVLKLEKSVDGLKDAREENIDKISKLHTASEQEVSEILLRFTGNSSSVDIIFNEEQKRRVLEKQINQIFSGAATDPVETEPVNIDDGTGGEMIKVGGIGRSLVYCGSFQKVDSIVPYDAVVEILPEVNINLLKSSDSIEPIWLKSDSSYYNSFADEQEIKETEYFEIFSEKLSGKDMEEAERFSVERVPKGACVSKDGLFVKNSNVSGSLDYKTGEACRKVFAATCRDSKFIHQFLPRGDDYPSEF